MHWIECGLLAAILCAACAQDLDAPTTLIKTDEDDDSKKNETNLQTPIPDFVEAELTTDSIQKVVTQSGELNSENSTAPNSDVQVSLQSEEKRDVENITFNDLKPLLLFPILPFLFPPREEESLNLGKNEFSAPENETSKIDGNPGSPGNPKPFIFFNFSFNIRRIPISNLTDNTNDSKIINVKKLSSDDSDDLKTNSLSNRKRRNTKVETQGFFDDASFFPDSELDEFLPKPDLIFPDLPFHRKSGKKLSRRKRDHKKTAMKNDLKSFFDSFDEAFMRTKRELEWMDPILNFLRGGEPMFQEEKKEADDFFSSPPEIREKPSVKWRIQRNIKRLNPEGQDISQKVQDRPTIIVDKVVKIGEFHVHDDAEKLNKREMPVSGRKPLGKETTVEETNSQTDKEYIPKNLFELLKKEGKKGNHAKNANPQEETYTNMQLKETRSPLQINDSNFPAVSKTTEEIVKKEANEDADCAKMTTTKKLINLVKMFSSLKGKMENEIQTMVQNPEKKQMKVASDAVDQKIVFQDNLKNLTEILNRFLEINKDINNAKLVDKIEVNERDDPKIFDWSEKEALQTTNALGNDFKGGRQKKDAYCEDEYVNLEKKEKQVADLNYLFLNVTLPTVFVFAAVLLVCFYSLQVKGKLCTKLFRPRQVLIVNEETPVESKNTGARKIQAI